MLHASHKSTVEPAIGIVGQVMHFRQFSVHGLEQVIGRVGIGVPSVQHQAAGGLERIRNDYKTTVFPPLSAALTKRYP